VPGSAGRLDLAGTSADQLTVLTAVARTTLFASSDIPTNGAQTLVVILTTTVINTASITLTIKGKDPASGTYYTILAGAAVGTNTQRVYRVSPVITASANVAANDVLPALIQISVAVADATAATYTIGAILS
jgi:hypothetical protein